MKRVFLIHGWEGRQDNHWFPWLTLELKARGFEVFAPAMPNADHPKVEEWVPFLKSWVGKPDEETYFVGHSLGCITTVRYLERLKPSEKVGGCVFVAGFSGRINVPEIAEFYSLPVDIEKARSHSKNLVCIFSDNDEYVPLVQSLSFSKQLGSKAILEKGKGHFCKGDGVTALQSVLGSLLSFSK